MRNIFQNLDPHMDFTHTHTQVCHTGRETNFQAAVSQSIGYDVFRFSHTGKRKQRHSIRFALFIGLGRWSNVARRCIALRRVVSSDGIKYEIRIWLEDSLEYFMSTLRTWNDTISSNTCFNIRGLFENRRDFVKFARKGEKNILLFDILSFNA